MSGNDCWNSVCFSCCRKADNELADVTLSVGQPLPELCCWDRKRSTADGSQFERRNSRMEHVLSQRKRYKDLLKTNVKRCDMVLNILEALAMNGIVWLQECCSPVPGRSCLDHWDQEGGQEGGHTPGRWQFSVWCLRMTMFIQDRFICTQTNSLTLRSVMSSAHCTHGDLNFRQIASLRRWRTLQWPKYRLIFHHWSVASSTTPCCQLVRIPDWYLTGLYTLLYNAKDAVVHVIHVSTVGWSYIKHDELRGTCLTPQKLDRVTSATWCMVHCLAGRRTRLQQCCRSLAVIPASATALGSIWSLVQPSFHTATKTIMDLMKVGRVRRRWLASMSLFLVS